MDSRKGVLVCVAAVALGLLTAGCLSPGGWLGPELRLRTETDSEGVTDHISYYVDEMGREIRHGRCLSYWPNGQLQRVVHFRHGNHSGLYRFWSPNGMVLGEEYYVADGEWIRPLWSYSWYDDGLLQEEVHWNPRTRVQLILRYSMHGEWSEGRLEEEHYELIKTRGSQSEIPVGRYREGYVNGFLATLGQYEAGKRAGTWVWYDNQGAKRAEGAYRNGEPYAGSFLVPSARDDATGTDLPPRIAYYETGVLLREEVAAKEDFEVDGNSKGLRRPVVNKGGILMPLSPRQVNGRGGLDDQRPTVPADRGIFPPP